MRLFREKFHWKYPNLSILLVSVLLTIIGLKNGSLQSVVDLLGYLGYFGILVAGLLFVSTFTVVPAAAVLFVFAKTTDPVIVAIIGGLGATIGDLIGFIFVRERLLAELNPLLKALHLYRRINIVNSRYFGWFAPVLGAAIIASPLPDELGLTLLGITKIKVHSLALIAFVLNTLGILLLAIAANS